MATSILLRRSVKNSFSSSIFPSRCVMMIPSATTCHRNNTSNFLYSQQLRYQSGGKKNNNNNKGNSNSSASNSRNSTKSPSSSSTSSSGGRAGASTSVTNNNNNNGRAGSSTQSSSSSNNNSNSTGGSGHGSGSGGGGGGGGGQGIDGDVIMNLMNLGKMLPGGRVLFTDVSLAFQRGAKIGVLGLNGSGKSSLLKILAGVDTEFDGTLWKSNGIQVGYLAQEPVLDESKNVHENIMDGLKHVTDLLAKFESVSLEMGEPDADLDALLAEQAEVQAEIDRLDAWNLSHVVQMAKEALRVPADEANVTSLSGGERRRVALCRLLLERPQVLLLDEPTNHLDATSVAWLERFLRDYKGTVLAVTHDRYFLDNVAGWILELDRGQAFPYQGNYSVWLAKKAGRLDKEKKADRKRARMMEEELEWIRAGPKARQSKSKARMGRFAALQETVADEKQQDRFLSGQIVIPPGPRLGDKVVEVKNVTKILPDTGRVLFSNVTFSIPPGAIVGVIGANGVGKTTLLRIITGELEPDAESGGSVVMGSTVVPSLVSQSREELSGDTRVLEAICGTADFVSYGSYNMPARQYLAAFNLVGELQTKLVRSLSGGERNRVHLAKALIRRANLLLLDEPTNDLDVDTLRSLEEALNEFAGVAIVVSHDRYFLDRVATHMLVFHGDGRVQWFEGGYDDYVQYANAIAPGEFKAGRKMYVLPGSVGAAAVGMDVNGTSVASSLKGGV